MSNRELKSLISDNRPVTVASRLRSGTVVERSTMDSETQDGASAEQQPAVGESTQLRDAESEEIDELQQKLAMATEELENVRAALTAQLQEAKGSASEAAERLEGEIARLTMEAERNASWQGRRRIR